MIAVDGTIFAFGFSKKYDNSLLLIGVSHMTNLPVSMSTSGALLLHISVRFFTFHMKAVLLFYRLPLSILEINSDKTESRLAAASNYCTGHSVNNTLK
jgi:hypothetical protein